MTEVIPGVNGGLAKLGLLKRKIAVAMLKAAIVDLARKRPGTRAVVAEFVQLLQSEEISIDDILARIPKSAPAYVPPPAKQPIPVEVRWRIWERDNFTCHYCGSRQFLAVDHKYPESKGGDLTDENLVTSCRGCNSKKGTKDYATFLQQLQEDQ